MTTPAHPQRCEHYDVCWFQYQHHKCINDNPNDIPCIFDTRKGVNFTLYIGRGDIALTEIEIALRKEESPSDNVQWAIERINRLQKEWDASHSSVQSRDKVLEVLDEILDTVPTYWSHFGDMVLLSDVEGVFKRTQGSRDQDIGEILDRLCNH